MHRNDKSKFLLYIEPSKSEKSEHPISDELTEFVEFALSEGVAGIANYSRVKESPNHVAGDGWRGRHYTDCGECSTNKDYLLKNGMITNSLAAFYIANYRSSISKNDWEKIGSLIEHYGKDIDVSEYSI